MKHFVEEYPLQIKKAIEIGNSAVFTQTEKKINNVVIAGLGGSGIGGTIAAGYLYNKIKVPVVVVKDYHIPEFVNEKTLFIASSYSGNTEETLEALAQAKKKKAEIVCITSGGKLLKKAREKGFNHIAIPKDYPPRAAFGYSFPQVLYVIHKYGLISKKFEKQLLESAEYLEKNTQEIKKNAMELANFLFEKIPVLYIASRFEGVAVRFRQQLNENSKMLAWHHAIPEMNHNELVGWRKKNNELAVVFFHTPEDYFRVTKRMEINKKIISEYTSNITDIYAKGDNYLACANYLVHLTDYTSVFLAELKNIDAVEVDVITYLKSELSKI
ncbi:MAG: bifunctional phosphoglucose/phosphomannose isomerase [Bacteroidetes bacterium]|nr:MAG: bifunctional phosphoglucose/phosphomannose isomerase [Bacteroidota bacterium]